MNEGVVVGPREADVGSILAFAPFNVGVLADIDFIRVSTFVALARSLKAKHGPRFAAPDSLVIMAESRQSFYGDGKRAA